MLSSKENIAYLGGVIVFAVFLLFVSPVWIQNTHILIFLMSSIGLLLAAFALLIFLIHKVTPSLIRPTRTEEWFVLSSSANQSTATRAIALAAACVSVLIAFTAGVATTYGIFLLIF
jgi:hypothetical protein